MPSNAKTALYSIFIGLEILEGLNGRADPWADIDTQRMAEIDP